MLPTRMLRRAFVLLVALWLAGCGPSVHPHVGAFLDAAEAAQIDVEGATGLGDVLAASVEGDSLAVAYEYPGPEGGRTGRLVGVLEGAELVGTYDTQGPDERFRGPLRLTFQADGSASGVWNDGEGTVDLLVP